MPSFPGKGQERLDNQTGVTQRASGRRGTQAQSLCLESPPLLRLVPCCCSGTPWVGPSELRTTHLPRPGPLAGGSWSAGLLSPRAGSHHLLVRTHLQPGMPFCPHGGRALFLGPASSQGSSAC